MIIDIHTHTFPDRIAERAVDKLKNAGHCSPFTDGTMSGLIDNMTKNNVDVSAVLPVVTNPMKTASVNDVSISMQGRKDIIYFGGIHPDTPMAQAELLRLVRAGVPGVKIHPVYQDVDIDDARYLRILEKAGELGLVVLMHAGQDIGFPGVVRCSPTMIRRALDQVGSVKLICAHMGGWRDWDQVTDCLGDTSAMVDTAFSLGFLDALDGKHYTPQERQMLTQEEFVRIVRSLGAQRVLFGSDSPWGDAGETAAWIDQTPLDQREKELIFSGNAAALLGI